MGTRGPEGQNEISKKRGRPRRNSTETPLLPMQEEVAAVTMVTPSQGESSRSPEARQGAQQVLRADARLLPIPDNSVDLIVTSPPYFQKRDYGVEAQIGLEETPERYVEAMRAALREWTRVLRPTGSLFLNVGDSYYRRSLAGIPFMLEVAARDEGWMLRNRIIWAKPTGMPDPSKNRLASRHEYILHFVLADDYYYDLFGYNEFFNADLVGTSANPTANPGDVWTIPLRRDDSNHLAPFPEGLVERAVLLAAPREVCVCCGQPRRRIVKRTTQLNPYRPQARRAMELALEKGLTPEHIAAIQSTGISDAGKAQRIQTGTGKNTARVQQLALEAKEALGGYFREYTFPIKATAGWTSCDCAADFKPGVVLDPFVGTGTTLRVATRLGFDAIGTDLAPAPGLMSTQLDTENDPLGPAIEESA